MDNKAKQMVVKYLLEKRAKEKGEAVYLESANTREMATYSEVFKMSNRVGHALAGLGIKKGQTVLTMLPRWEPWLTFFISSRHTRMKLTIPLNLL